ncbi:NAD(P)-dependent alcohol dehydrogenase [Bacillus wiedmannii]|uniref:NAD(P)-dependent alcohol dehydrogenase n=1 Tax=Bacillus wiedmannii TaxID=1890302 RepID=A0A4U2N1Q5_9BACI|nr:NAD(P)-dependent alcohol dehydrogenase [Bacillus wiedmannii]TKH17204.1 NAD(P)-dependent alcohol dehydrogenase [Bacillus wiedmannii]
MKAIICTQYGPPNVLQLQNIEKPTPKKNEVLVKIHATSVSTGDCRIRGFNSPLLFWIPMRIILGFRKPRNPILGVELSGEIEEIGTAAVQLAKYFGATVTAVCSNSNFELVQSLGADKVIDYTKEDFTKLGERYNIIFDAVGKHKKSLCEKALTPNGKYVSVNGMMAKVSKEDMILLKKLTEAEHLKPVIDRTYRLEEIAEAHIYVEKGHKKGNVSITLK